MSNVSAAVLGSALGPGEGFRDTTRRTPTNRDRPCRLARRQYMEHDLLNAPSKGKSLLCRKLHAFYAEGVGAHSPGSRQRTLGNRGVFLLILRRRRYSARKVADAATPSAYKRAGLSLSRRALARRRALR